MLAPTLETPVILLFDPEQKEVRASTHCEIEGLCFFVSIRCMHTGQQNRAAVVSCAYELRHYLEVAKDVEIHRVQMACPPSITGQCQWTLSELESVIIYSGVDTDESAVVYRTKSGVLKLGDLDLRKRKNLASSIRTMRSQIVLLRPASEGPQ